MEIKKIIHAALMIPICILIVALGYYATNIIFFEFDEDATQYTISAQSGEQDALAAQFTYNGKEIVLLCGDELEASEFLFYGLTDIGVAVMSEENLSYITATYTGSFMAKGSSHYSVSEIDGGRIRIFPAARTDMEFSQADATTAVAYDSELYPVDILFHERKYVQVLYLGEPLADTEISVTTADGSVQTMVTDGEGYLGGLAPLDARNGFTIYFSPNELDYYLMSYIVQRTSLFSVEHAEAMIPLFIITGLSALIIFLCIFLRRRMRKHGTAGLAREKSGGALTRGAVYAKQSRSKFMILRWGIMIGSFFLLTYGSQLFGIWFTNVSLPFLACEVNDDQLVLGSCYYLANLDLLFAQEWHEIVLFFGTFLISIVLLGRLICGFICPMGFIQDLVHSTRQALRIEGLSFTDKMFTALQPVKWAMVILMLGLCFVGGKFCEFCPAKAFTPALAGFQTSLYTSGFIMIVSIVGSFFKRRFWCTICPLGLLMGLFHKASIFRLKKESRACTGCGACYEACPMGIKEIYTEREESDVTSMDCILCGECVRRCPENDALAITCCGKRIYTAKRKNVRFTPIQKESVNR